jgi:hypothetical protein
MDLRRDYNYSLTNNSGGCSRKRRLKKAIRDSNFDIVFQELEKLIEELDGYKSERARQDLSFLVKNQHKYYTERDDYSLRIKKIRANGAKS